MSKIRNTNRKWSNMLSTKYRNHQHVDDKAFQEASNCKRYFYDKSCWEKMQRSDTNLYTHMTYAALQDNISETNRDALEKLHMSFVKLEEKVLETNNVETEVAIIEPELKPKDSKHKWLAWGAGAALAGVMAHLFKN